MLLISHRWEFYSFQTSQIIEQGQVIKIMLYEFMFPLSLNTVIGQISF